MEGMMKIIRFLVLIAVLVPSLSFADMVLDTPEVRPDIDRFRIARFEITNRPGTVQIYMNAEFGYESDGFIVARASTLLITNNQIVLDKKVITPELPPGYESTPATKVIQEINSGSFGGQATAQAYIELIFKTLLGL
jgi:hypothetical protein